MINGKFIATLTALVAVVFAICNINTQSFENFTGTRAVRSEIVQDTRRNQAMYSVPPNLQPNLAPRSNGFANMCASVRYNVPSSAHLAAPVENFQHVVKEDYCGCSTPNCNKNGSVPMNDPTVMSSDYSNGNYGNMVDSADMKGSVSGVIDQIPMGTMETTNSLGESENVVMANRLIFANPNSRLRALGDPIRGDLPITPCNTGWFQVSVNPNLDLQAGAMNVMGGVQNETNNGTAAVINAQAGSTVIGGVNMSTPQLASIGACSDITVSTFA
jgi:hypothetical protein